MYNGPRPLLAIGAGFTDYLYAAGRERPDVILVDPTSLYSGD